MLPGAFSAVKKSGDVYYRSNITYKNKHISLGSFDSEKEAHEAYLEADRILNKDAVKFTDISHYDGILSFHKLIVLLNFRDNRIYIKTPIYLHASYFSYFISRTEELKFDVEDLFLYSNHKILKRGGYLFISEFGMQTNILGRYGIRNFAVPGRDFMYSNGDSLDYRYSNIIVINPYFGVFASQTHKFTTYVVIIHINGNYRIGEFNDPVTAAIAYNKAVDQAKKNGCNKNFPENYIDEVSASQYADIYSKIRLPRKYIHYLKQEFTVTSDS